MSGILCPKCGEISESRIQGEEAMTSNSPTPSFCERCEELEKEVERLKSETDGLHSQIDFQAQRAEVAESEGKRLKEENEALRKDVCEVLIKELHYDGKDFSIMATTGLGRCFADLIRTMLVDQNASNFVSYRLEFSDLKERYYVVAGRCDGLTLAEKYEQVANENKELKSREHKWRELVTQTREIGRGVIK